MSGVQCRSIQEREERTSESCVVLSAHSPFAAVFRGLQGSKAHAMARGQKNVVLKDPKRCEKAVLTHPSDASQWRALDGVDASFATDLRNLKLGVITDGVNPYSNQSSTHSTWPVFVWIYNLPPWLCMKSKYIHMCMLIQGPKQPGNDINLYLKLLKDELDTLWEGVNTWDAVAEEYFPMRVALLCTVHDYLGHGYVAGQVCYGHWGCMRCMDDPTFMQLKKDPGSSKTV